MCPFQKLPIFWVWFKLVYFLAPMSIQAPAIRISSCISKMILYFRFQNRLYAMKMCKNIGIVIFQECNFPGLSSPTLQSKLREVTLFGVNFIGSFVICLHRVWYKVDVSVDL